MALAIEYIRLVVLFWIALLGDGYFLIYFNKVGTGSEVRDGAGHDPEELEVIRLFNV